MTRSQAVFAVSLILSLVAWALGMWGFYLWAGPTADHGFPLVGDAAYRSLQLFDVTLQPPPGVDPGTTVPWRIQVARFLAPAAAVTAIVSAIWVFVRVRIGGLWARWQRDHIVVCGAGDKGTRLVRRFRRGNHDGIGGRKVVVLDRAPAEATGPTACRELGALTVTGDARDPASLKRAGVEKARYLVLVCGADGTNAEIALQARALLPGGRTRALHCFAHVTDPGLCRLLRERELEVGVARNFRLEFFNIYSSATRALLREHRSLAEARHVVVVGLDAFGRSVVRAMARAPLGDASAEGAAPRLHVTIYDEGAREKVEAFRRSDPGTAARTELRPRELDRSLPSFDSESVPGADRVPPIDAACICLHDDGQAVAAALALLRAVPSARFPVVVGLMEDTGLATLLDQRRGEFRRLRGFPILDHGCTEDVLRGRNEELARAVHEDYRRAARDRGREFGSDPSLAPWSTLPESLRRSNRRQADHIFTKLEAIGCALMPRNSHDMAPFQFESDEVDRLARMEHDRWVQERREDGWRPGPTKDVERKETPYLVPWEELDEETRELDRDAVRRLPELVAMVDLEIVRIQGEQKAESEE